MLKKKGTDYQCVTKLNQNFSPYQIIKRVQVFQASLQLGKNRFMGPVLIWAKIVAVICQLLQNKF